MVTCAPLKKCRTEINETFVDNAENTNIAIPMYNLTEYSDNYSDTSDSLWQFKRFELSYNDVNTISTNDNAPSFKCKASIIGDIGADGKKKGVKIAVLLKYLSNFWRSLEMPLISCKVEISSDWYTKCIIIIGGTAETFLIRDAKLYVPVVTLKTEDNAKLSTLLNEGFEIDTK